MDNDTIPDQQLAPGVQMVDGDNIDNTSNAKTAGKKNVWKYVAIACAVLAIVGMAIGIAKAIEANTLSAELGEVKKEKNDLLVILDDGLSDQQYAPTQIHLVPSVTKKTDYLYVGEWGIKIKKPENWQNLIREYTFYNDYPQAVDTLEIKENPEIPTAHALIANEGEKTCESITINYDACFVVGGKAIIVSGLPGVDTGEVTDEFRNFVINSDNYSTI